MRASRTFLLFLPLAIVAGFAIADEEPVVESTSPLIVQPKQPANIDEQATHVDTSKISVPDINAFAIDSKGRILAACGKGPGEIKVLDSEGTEIRSWKVDINPESIHAAKNGDVLVAGVGKLLRFDISGKLLQSAESPHAKDMRNNADKMREEAIKQLKRRPMSAASIVEAYKGIIAQLEKKKEQGNLTPAEDRMLEQLPRTLKIYEERLAAEKEVEEKGEPSEEKIQQLVDSMMKSKLRIASISTNGEHTFVATRALVGYGYSVWKMNNDFTGGEQIITGLSGCCGQMDVQCCESGIYVAENSRHRVVAYDTDGKQRITWGKGDRTGVDGFTSCCNPMNVCFNKDGHVFTSESNTGRIKQFDKDGNFIAFIGDVKLVPGCKNVSIAVAPDNERVYMLDITRGHIVIMQRKAGEATDTTSVESTVGAES